MTTESDRSDEFKALRRLNRAVIGPVCLVTGGSEIPPVERTEAR